MKRSSRNLLLVGTALAGLIVLLDSVYVVCETNQVIITQFGEPIGGAVTTPGLHLKVPFVQKANYFEKRWLEWDGEPNQIPTKDKKYIWVETYCRWRISNPLVFYQRVTDERGAQSRLDDIVDGETRNASPTSTFRTVRSPTGILNKPRNGAPRPIRNLSARITSGRDQIAQIILEHSSKITSQFGVELKDVRSCG